MQLRRPKQFLISPYQTVFTLCLFCVYSVFYKKKPSAFIKENGKAIFLTKNVCKRTRFSYKHSL